MPKDTIIKSITDWFEQSPVLRERINTNANGVNVDNLPENDREYCIEAVPCDPVVRAYVDGSAKKQYMFVFAGREVFGEKLDNLSNSEFYENVANWIDEQADNGGLPQLPEPLETTKLTVTSCGYVIDSEESKARYQIQCRLEYYQPAKKSGGNQ